MAGACNLTPNLRLFFFLGYFSKNTGSGMEHWQKY